MPRYDFRCDDCAQTVELTRRHDEAGDPATHACGRAMRRLYRVSRPIVRPTYYNARPGDTNYDNFDRELELGEVKSPGDLPESRGATPTGRRASRPTIDRSGVSVEAERNLRQAVEAAIVEV